MIGCCHGDKLLTGLHRLVIFNGGQLKVSIVNDAKFSSLFYLIGQIYTNLDHSAPVHSINIENFTKNVHPSGTLTGLFVLTDW